MIKRQREKLYEKAIDRWGGSLQHLMLIEECGELIQATSKILRKGKDCDYGILAENLAEEIADVELMIEQVKFMNKHICLSKRVEVLKLQKLERLEKMLRSSE